MPRDFYKNAADASWNDTSSHVYYVLINNIYLIFSKARWRVKINEHFDAFLNIHSASPQRKSLSVNPGSPKRIAKSAGQGQVQKRFLERKVGVNCAGGPRQLTHQRRRPGRRKRIWRNTPALSLPPGCWMKDPALRWRSSRQQEKICRFSTANRGCM